MWQKPSRNNIMLFPHGLYSTYMDVHDTKRLNVLVTNNGECLFIAAKITVLNVQVCIAK